MEILSGSLKVKKGQITLIPKDEDKKSVGIGSQILTKSLYEEFNSSPAALNGVEVEFEFDSGQPVKVRKIGEAFQDTIRPKTVKTDHFHNPYNFVPALTRGQITGELADDRPVGHGRYCDDYWSGRIAVKLTTITPLLIPDASEMTENAQQHKTFGTRCDTNGQPYLPPTSIKGMLRSAYEAVTNSRLSVFVKHDSQLAYRSEAKNTAIPARVEKRGQFLYLCLLKELSCIGDAAKLPRYEENGSPPDKGESIDGVALKYQGSDNLPQHGDRVRVQISDSQITQIEPWTSDSLPDEPWKLGWVCITGANIGKKQYERVFIQQVDPPSVKTDKRIKELWTTLISNYQEIHKKDLEKRDRDGDNYSAYLGHKPGDTAWSRHIYTQDELELKDGTLCYVELANGCNPQSSFQSTDIVALQPVTISRRLYKQKPDDLLDNSLKPAQNMTELSPADRVFGWVRQKGHGSYKGQLRVHSVQCLADDWRDDFESSDTTVPLAILGQPKPQQARFYNSQDDKGTPLKDGNSKESGYQSKRQGLRGRKVYPHHQGLPKNYWEHPSQDRTQNAVSGHYQEYRHPDNGKEQSDQNRSMRDWVKEGVDFRFDIDVINLLEVELGALLYLLRLPDIHFHRLGGGKPLGFGSVRLDIIEEETDLRIGQDWSRFYESLIPDDAEIQYPLDLQNCIQKYQDTVKAAYGNGQSFEEVRFIKAFCRCAKGFDDNAAVRYPPSPESPKPGGESFKWFVDNERTEGKKLSLPPLYEPKPLPVNPK